MINEFLEQICKEPDKHTLHKAKLAIIDWIGYSIAGTFSKQATPFKNLQSELPKGSSLNLFDKKSLSPLDSAFINAAVGNILELDDVHRTSIIHPGDTIIPAAIATSSFKPIYALEFLKSLVLGYETAIRMGICLGTDHYKIFYSSATCGVFGAAAASSYILNHDQNKNLALTKLNYSIQLATMNSSGIWQCRKGEGEAKQYALANASRSGLTSALLAQKNAKTPVDMIEGELGFLKAFTNKTNFKALIKKENTHLINEVSNKPWPACRHSHPVIGVALELKKIIKKEKINIEDIKFIEIETYQTAIDFCNKPNPTNEIEGKFSLQHCCAISLIFEDIKESYFEKSILNNFEIESLRKKIRVNSNKQMSINFPKNYSVQIKIKFNNDEELTQKSNHAKGDPENPMSEKEICDKTLDLVNRHIKNNKCNYLIEKILNTNIENDKSSIVWFNDLQQIINGKGY